MLRKNRRSFSDEQLIEAVASSYSIAQVLVKLNLSPTGANYKGFKKLVKEFSVDTSHFTGQGHLKGKTHDWNPKVPIEEILVENSSYTSTNGLKKRLLKEGLLEYKCNNCGIVDWDGKPLALHLDHINGIGDDNRIENLRLLCPNCHSQTDTFAGRNIKINRRETPQGKEPRIKKIKYSRKNKELICPFCNDSFIGEKRQKYCGYDCARAARWKIERPSKEQLQEDIDNLSFCAIGRKYGVSDNAIRKWARQYGIL